MVLNMVKYDAIDRPVANEVLAILKKIQATDKAKE
jgi:hypothetical protein